MLNIHSIFQSISGEVGGFPQGSRAAFVRLSGCNLCCPYCDTPETQTSKKAIYKSVGSITRQLISLGLENIIITGGEPLLQKDGLITLCTLLADYGRKISIETNGTLPIPEALLMLPNLSFVMDWKFRSIYQDDHKPCTHNKYEIFRQLRRIDIIKFVVNDEMEILNAIQIQQQLQNKEMVRAKFAYSPVITDDLSQIDQDARPMQRLIDNANKIMYLLEKHQIDAILNLQIHKILDVF